MYKGIYDNYIIPSSLGKMELKNIKQIHVQNFFNANNHLSYSTLKKFYFLLSQSLNAAVDNNLIRKNPTKGIIIPNKNLPQKEIDILTLSQQKAYVQALDGELYKALYLTALFTGMRIGEIIALKWECVDLENNLIHVNKSIRRVKVYEYDGNSQNKYVTKEPKTKAGTRIVPLPDFLADEYKRRRPIVGREEDILKKYVFETSTGKPQSARNIRKYHDRICTRAKINPIKIIKDDKIEIIYKGISLHGLRHTFATRMIESGESPKVLQAILGHVDVQTTLNIYAHVLTDQKVLSASKQNNLFLNLIEKN